MHSFVERNHPALTQKSNKIDKLTKNQQKQIKEMKKLLEVSDGAAAISANQLGITDLKVFVCKNNEEILAVINPKITWTSMDNPEEIVEDGNGVVPKAVPMWEGCLSFPGHNYLITRPFAVKVEYMNEKGVYKSVMLTDQWARLFSHEIDHLNGIRVEDRAEEVMAVDENNPVGYLPSSEVTT